MKRFLSFCLCAMLMLCCGLLAACSASPMEEAVKRGDNYTVACAYDDGAKALSAVQTVEAVNRTENSFKCVKFHVFANQYREDAQNCVVPQTYKGIAYPNGESYGGIEIDCVKINGVSVPFSLEGEDADILSVPTEEWFPDKKLTVEITYTVTLANIKHRLGWTENTVNLGNFFPVLCHIENGQYQCTPYYNLGDPFVSDCANFNVTLKTADKFLVAATGNLTEVKSENGYATYTYNAPAVRDFAFVLSDKYKKISQTVGNVAINYYYFADENCENSLQTAVKAFEFYTENIGAYPYKQLSVCETEFCYGGMEYPSLVMVTSGSQAYTEAIAHEVAHQWFYGVVGNDQIANAWMDEGLAEYLTYLYLDSTGATKLSQNVLANIRTYTTYVDVLNNYYNEVDTTFRSLDKFKNDNEYVVMTYIKGSLLFNTLYETMGKAKFFRALAAYYREAQFTVAPPAQMMQCFADVGSTELANIFTAFAEGKEILGKVTD